MTTTALPLSASLIIISFLSCKSLRADLSVCVKLSVLGTCTSTLCLISDLIRSITDSSLVFLLSFEIQLLFLTNLGISITSFMPDSPLISHTGILMTFYLSIILDLQNFFH
jgi:hypothetical protein